MKNTSIIYIYFELNYSYYLYISYKNIFIIYEIVYILLLKQYLL